MQNTWIKGNLILQLKFILYSSSNSALSFVFPKENLPAVHFNSTRATCPTHFTDTGYITNVFWRVTQCFLGGRFNDVSKDCSVSIFVVKHSPNTKTLRDCETTENTTLPATRRNISEESVHKQHRSKISEIDIIWQLYPLSVDLYNQNLIRRTLTCQALSVSQY